jgi:alkylation response protein AidB-like acyl-CoA dehydrogenase
VEKEKKLGLDGNSTTALMLEDCRVPVENVLGEIGKGHVVAFNILNLGRLKLGSRNIGGANISLNHSIAYAKERFQFGRPIASFGLIKRKLAEMAIRCFVGDAIVYRSLGLVDKALAGIDHNAHRETLKAIERFASDARSSRSGPARRWPMWLMKLSGLWRLRLFPGLPRRAPIGCADPLVYYEGTNEINRLIIPPSCSRARRRVKFLEAPLSSVPDRIRQGNESLEGLGYAEVQLRRAKRTAIQHRSLLSPSDVEID